MKEEFGTEKLQNLFNIIQANQNLFKYSKNDICKTFPINWKVRQKILSSNKTGILAIFKIDFKNINELNNIIKYLRKSFKLDIDKITAEDLKQSLYKRLNEVNSDAIFQDFERNFNICNDVLR